MRYFTFAGIDSRTHFLTNFIKRPFLPPVMVPTIEIPRRAGVSSLPRNEIGVREIQIGVTMMGVSHVDIRQRVRNLSAFLIKESDQELIFSDELDKKYMARFNQNNNDLEELAYVGSGVLTFTCFDPYAYSVTPKTVSNTTQQFVITNAGTVRLFPSFRIVPSVNAELIKLKNVTTGKEIVYNATWPAITPLLIDMKTNRVYHDATKENFIKNVTLASEFFPLEVGANTIRVETMLSGAANISSLRTDWIERFY